MWQPDDWNITRITERLKLPCDRNGIVMWEIITALVEAGADAMHNADIEFLKRHYPELTYRTDGVGFITIVIQKEDWEAFTTKEDKDGNTTTS